VAGVGDPSVVTFSHSTTALAVALIFGAVFAAFIAFCDFVWFR
jgi:hypothetical protein